MLRSVGLQIWMCFGNHLNKKYICRICIITLANTHPILQKGHKIKNIDYRISDGCSRLNNKVSGKSKRVSIGSSAYCHAFISDLLFCSKYTNELLQGGQFLTEFAPLCRITCTDGNEYTIFRWVAIPAPITQKFSWILIFCLVSNLIGISFSCIRGRLLEVNEEILKRPDLLLEKVAF